jgi:hypothetical protein
VTVAAPEKTAALSSAEQDRLVALEEIVEAGFRTFVDVGRALAEIRDRRLYLVSHANFQAYLRDRWDFSAQRAYQLIYTSDVAEAITSSGYTLPLGVTSNAMRELVALRNQDGDEAVAAAWREVTKRHGGQRRAPSAGEVRAVLVDLGLRSTPPRPPRPARLAAIGEGLQAAAGRITRFRRELDGRPLPPSARQQAAECAAIARRVVAALEDMADVSSAASDLSSIEERAAEPEGFCVWHGRFLSGAGVCTLCGQRASRPG